MQENYTNPEQVDEEQTPQDLLNASLIFARALSLILKQGEGLVVDIKGNINLGEDVKKVIVFQHQEQVHIYKCEEDIPEGTAVNMNPPEDNSEIIEEPNEKI